MKDHRETRSWLIRSASEQLSQVLEAMAGEAPIIESHVKADPPVGGGFRFWELTISTAPGATLILAAPEKGWRQLGSKILAAAGLDLDDDETLRSTFQETVDQAFSGMAQAAGKHIGREVSATPTKPSSYVPSNSGEEWSELTLAFADGLTVDLFLLSTAALLSGFQPKEESLGPAPPPAPIPVPVPPMALMAAADGKNADLLFDVELPVCVSFGRAHLQLRDVMKLTTGSVVELNRTVTEPVEVIVNNCVIARGEVVVVEGNFGVRINEIISRQERLRTLH